MQNDPKALDLSTQSVELSFGRGGTNSLGGMEPSRSIGERRQVLEPHRCLGPGLASPAASEDLEILKMPIGAIH